MPKCNVLTNIGVYTGDIRTDDQDLFVVERRAFHDLCQGLVRPCSCWHSTLWELMSTVQVFSAFFQYYEFDTVN